MADIYPPELSPEDIKLKIRQTFRNPNIGKTHRVTLKDGPQAYRIATIFEIVDPATGGLHHLSLQFDSFNKTKKAWKLKPDRKVRIEGKDPNEIKILSDFLNAVLSEHYPESAGDYRVVTENQYNIIKNFSEILPNVPGKKKIELAKLLFQSFECGDIDAHDFLEAFKNTTPDAVKNISVAARFVQYKAEFIKFHHLVESADPSESKYQNHLQKNPWIFGSEYSELLDRRTWTRDDNLDFMLRRTVDGYLEIIEIKTPAVIPLFNYDKNHDSYYLSSQLSKVIGQVFRYIDEVERNRDSIIVKDRLDPLKIRARIIIGKDGNKEQQAALRTLNSHLHRVEVLTFDQLIRVAQRTLEIFESQISGHVNEKAMDRCDDDIPF